MSRCCDPSYRLLGARYLRRQVRQLADQFDGIRRGEDTECVHRARVASRRLRAALRMFRDCWGRKKVARWRKGIRRITRELGEARDQDVQIDVLCSLLGENTDKSYVLGISRVLARAERRRERLQTRVLKAVNRFQRSRVLGEILSATNEVLAVSGAETAPSSDFTRDQARQTILRRLEQLLDDQQSLEDPKDCRGHHTMRIAAKRLRYTLEIARPLYSEPFDAVIEATKKVQSLLGEVHDCDVWLAHLETFAREESGRVCRRFSDPGPFARQVPGIDYLRRRYGERRDATFRQLVDYWHELERQGVWDQLVRMVEAPGDAGP